MAMKRLWQAVGTAFALGVISEILYQIWSRKLWSRRQLNKEDESIETPQPTVSKDSSTKESQRFEDPYLYQVLMFPDKKRACKAHFWGGGCHAERCWFSHDETNRMYRFLSHIKAARQTLDVCVYVMTDADLANFVIGMKSTGVLVRVITNQEAQNYTGTQVGKLRARGIQVRNNNNYLMHHKFVVVDREMVITGSFNWTSHATTANNENMIITNNPQIVGPYVQEFDKLWTEFDPSLQS